MFLSSLTRPLGCLLSIGFQIAAVRAADPAAEPARAVLADDDGWASVTTAALPRGTTGGSNAAPNRTVTVTNRNELIAALAWPDATPKLIFVRGRINVKVDDSLKPLTCAEYRRVDPATGEPYSLYAFLAMYDPEGPGGKAKQDPFGGQENARAASAAAQAGVRCQLPIDLGRGLRVADLFREQSLRNEREFCRDGNHRRQEGYAHHRHRQLLARQDRV